MSGDGKYSHRVTEFKVLAGIMLALFFKVIREAPLSLGSCWEKPWVKEPGNLNES